MFIVGVMACLWCAEKNTVIAMLFYVSKTAGSHQYHANPVNRKGQKNGNLKWLFMLVNLTMLVSSPSGLGHTHCERAIHARLLIMLQLYHFANQFYMASQLY